MTVCRFYQQGHCNRGENCSFEHTDSASQGGFNNESRGNRQPRNQQQNFDQGNDRGFPGNRRGGGFQSDRGSRGRSGGGGGGDFDGDGYQSNRGGRGQNDRGGRSQGGGFQNDRGGRGQGGFQSDRNDRRGGGGGFQPERGGRGNRRGGGNEFGNNNTRGRGGRGGRGSNNDDLQYLLGLYFGRDSIDEVKHDIRVNLSLERPQWPFSCFNAGTSKAPCQLIEGKAEQSPEEMRFHAYNMATRGISHIDIMKEETEANKAMTEIVTMILRDLDGAIQHILDHRNIHPNRQDEMFDPTAAEGGGGRGGRGNRGNRRGRGGRGGGGAAAPDFSKPPGGPGPYGHLYRQQSQFVQQQQDHLQPKATFGAFDPFANNLEGYPTASFGGFEDPDIAVNVASFYPDQDVNMDTDEMNQPPNSHSFGGQADYAAASGSYTNAVHMEGSDALPTALFGLSADVFRDAHSLASQQGQFVAGNVPWIPPEGDSSF